MKVDIAPILVWRFYDAPKHLQDLSTHGGDEDWLAVIPPECDQPDWMETGKDFGCYDVWEYPHPLLPGHRVFIGAHA